MIFLLLLFFSLISHFHRLLPHVVYVIVVFVVENSIQETDGGYFEAFTALAWKRDNRRMSAVRTAETRAEMIPEKEHDAQAHEEIDDTPDEKEQLYIEVLQTIANAVGAPAPGGQVCITNLLKTKKNIKKKNTDLCCYFYFSSNLPFMGQFKCE